MEDLHSLAPYPKKFPELLQDYCRQIGEANTRNWHHDQRRAVFMNFFREGFGVEASEVELEHKVKVAQVRGYIDALFDTTIIEFKSSVEKERATGVSELELYFKSRKKPSDFIAVLTDGEIFELYQWDNGRIERFDSFTLRADQPIEAYLKLDQFRTAEKKRQPRSNDIVIRFGPHSAVYRQAMALMHDLFNTVKNNPTVTTKFREWNKLLAKVYGAELGDGRLFLTHTYLVVLSRLMVAQALFPRDSRGAEMYRGIMTGEYFTKKNLPNLAEPDFFAWALATDVENHFIGLIGRIERYVAQYDFSATEEDILKELYQGLVDPADRHDLGEYYTPDWLAELTLERMGYHGGSLLDPSCGSGTFLMCAIRCLRGAGYKKTKLVDAVSHDLAGIDVHPLAVLMAKANLLLALGTDARGYKGQLRLPIFMADTLQTELDEKKGYLKIPAAKGSTFHLPLQSIESHSELLDDMIEQMQILAHAVAEGGVDMEAAKSGFLKKFPMLQNGGNGEVFYWRQNLETAAKLIRQKRNSIWSFILKNSYRPTFLRKRKVDYIAGNPPWLSYRYIRDEAYKERVRELCFEYELLKSTNRALITQIELATIFYRHCERHFLREGGVIGLVLPWGAMGGAKQHENFQQQGGFTHAMDFHEVTGLFNVPCCVLIGSGEKQKGTPQCESFKGIINERNPGWKKVKVHIKIQTEALKFVTHEIRSPWYREVTLQGATIVPRSLFFIERDPECADVPDAPYVRTSRETLADAKSPWNHSDVQMSGQIEKQFIYYTVLAKGIVPFGFKRAETIYLPIQKDSHGKISLLDSNQLISEGNIHAATWLSRSEKLWEKYRKNNNRLLDWINYNQKLTNQNLKKKCILLYNCSGTNLTSSILIPEKIKKINSIQVNGFVADAKTYYLYLDSLDHADYLCAVLNSESVMEAIKETMPKGLMGERDIHRRPFEVCEIPLYDPKNELHQRIATIGEICRKKAEKAAEKLEGPIGQARKSLRALFGDEIFELNKLVVRLLKEGDKQPKKRWVVKDDDELTLF